MEAGSVARAVFEFLPSVSEELPLFVGDVIEVLSVVDEFWLLGKKDGVTGAYRALTSWKGLGLLFSFFFNIFFITDVPFVPLILSLSLSLSLSLLVCYTEDLLSAFSV